MSDALHTRHDLLFSVGDCLLASAVCCCPSCDACSDPMDRANNANINTGAPLTYSGDTSSFAVAGGTIRTSVSNKLVTVCDGDRVTVDVRSDSGGEAYVKLGSLKGFVKLSPDGSTSQLLLTGGASGVITLKTPLIGLNTRLTLCIGGYNGMIGVQLYSTQGNYRVYDNLAGTYDPNAAAYGTAGFGTGLISGTMVFDNLKVQHSQGSGELSDCPQCSSKPCAICEDFNFNDPLTNTRCQWTVASGAWTNGFTHTSHAVLQMGESPWPSGSAPRCVWVSYTFNFLNHNHGDAVRLYLQPSYDDGGTFIEVIQPKSGKLGCARMVHNGVEIATASLSPLFADHTSIDTYWGQHVWAMSSPANLWVDLDALDGGAFPGTGIAVGTGALEPGSAGISIGGVQIARAASDDWPYCLAAAQTCAITSFPPERLASKNPFLTCALKPIGGSNWRTDSSSNLLADTSNSWIQLNSPHPGNRSGGCASVFLPYESNCRVKRISWAMDGGAPSDYLEVEHNVSVGTMRVRSCFGTAAVPFVGWSKLRLFVGGGLVAESDFLPTLAGEQGIALCVGEEAIRVSLPTACGLMTIFDYAHHYLPGSNPYWGMGVGPISAGSASPGSFTLAHAFDTSPQNLFSLPPSPSDCQHCHERDCATVCADGMPSVVKVVLSGVVASGAGPSAPCDAGDCESIDGIYFVPIMWGGGGGVVDFVMSGCPYGLVFPAYDTTAFESSCSSALGAIYVDFGTFTDATSVTGPGVRVWLNNAEAANLTADWVLVSSDLCHVNNRSIPFRHQDATLQSCDFSVATVTISWVG